MSRPWFEEQTIWYKGHRVRVTRTHYWGRKSTQWYWVTELEDNENRFLDWRWTWFEAVDAINAEVENNPED